MPTANTSKPVRPGLKDDTSGSVFVESALVLPIVCIILACMVEWGLALYQYNLLTTTTGRAVRELTVSRGYDNPYTSVLDIYATLAKTLGVKDSDITVRVDGVPCSSDADCKSKLSNALTKPASVEVNYTCVMQFTPASASPCPIDVVMTGMVE